MAQTARPKRYRAAVTESEMIEGATHGDERAFRAIMEQNNQRLYRLARSIIKDDGEAEEIVQETYLRAFTALPTFRGDALLSTWLTRIAFNEALGRKRKARPVTDLSAVEAMQERSAQIIGFPTMSQDINPEHAVAQREIRKLIE